MGVFIIGSGRVASYFASEIVHLGIGLIGIHSRNQLTGKALCQKLKVLFFNKIPKLSKNDILLVCINDNSLYELNLKFTLATVFHTSGAVSIEVLKEFSANHGVFYPLQTFAGIEIEKPLKFPILIESSNEDTKVIGKELSNRLRLEYHLIDSLKRKEIHINAVILNNFITFLLRKVHERNLSQNIDSHIYMSLLNQTYKNSFLSTHGFNPQTGPAIRGDDSTIQKHLEILEKEDSKLFDLYRFFTNMIQKD